MTENNSDENLRVNIFLQISSKFQLIFNYGVGYPRR